MTSPIKPPGPSSAPSVPGADANATTAQGASAFRTELDRSDAASEATSAARTEQGSLTALGAEVRAGRISAQEAVDAMVTRATAIAPEGMRAELERTLRAYLESDPTLVALTRDLERAKPK